MKKLYVDSSEIPPQEDQDQIRRLYRYISDAARRLDESRGRACCIRDLFTPQLLSQRSRLQEHCEKLIFMRPLSYGQKCEELLWRKAYYDVVSTAKRLKKQPQYTPDEIAHLNAHINAGIGHYHHTIARLQVEYDLNLDGVIDFSIISNLNENNKLKNGGGGGGSTSSNSNSSSSEKIQMWANNSVHRCLIYLGDLSRYRLEYTLDQDPVLAVRYYIQAFNFNPDLGIPHNQLGSLAATHNYSLDSAYHYMRCLSSPQPFDGSEGNLIRLFEKNSTLFDEIMKDKDYQQNGGGGGGGSNCSSDPINHIKQLICRFLLLIDIWYFNKDFSDLNNLCQQTLLDLQTCLNYPKPLASESGDSTEEITANSCTKSELLTPQYVRPDIVFKMIVMCLLCISKLQEKLSSKISAVVAFTLAIYSQLVKEVIEHIQDSVLNLSISSPQPNVKVTKKFKKKKSVLKLRRRRKRINSSEDSDLSDTEIPYESSSSECDSNISETDELEDDDSSSDILDHSEDSDEEEEKENENETDTETKCIEIQVKPTENGIVQNGAEKIKESLKKLRRLDPNDVLELIADEGLLQSIKILSDWLQGDIEIIKACGKSSQILIQRIIQLINLINVDTKNKCLDNVKVNAECLDKIHHTVALPEDIVLKNMPILKYAQKHINWQSANCKMYLPKEEALIRLYKLVAFGHFLKEIADTGVTYNEKERRFDVVEIVQNGDCDKSPIIMNEDNNQKADGTGDNIGQQVSKGALMKSMGQLWLAAEVRDLECKVRGRTALSPYLVLDIDALILHTHLVKQLVAARKFIVVVPSVVVSGLDELKRETGKARDAIRWLEAQFQRGNRFLRAQRNHEHAAIPLIKYPKKKDKQAFIYIQIIECCYFLTKQQKDSSDLVTLLTGKPTHSLTKSSSDTKEISYTGLAQTAGIALEHILTFHIKWKKSLKGKR